MFPSLKSLHIYDWVTKRTLLEIELPDSILFVRIWKKL